MESLERFSVPTKYDAAPYGTLCSVKQDDDTIVYYIQISNDPECIVWERVGYFLEGIFLELIKDPSFREQCLKKRNLDEIIIAKL